MRYQTLAVYIAHHSMVAAILSAIPIWGYETLYKNILVNADITLPIARMELSQTELEGVEITAYRKPFKLNRDGITADVPNTILAKQTTLNDLLCKIPGIQQRGDAIEVIGKGIPTYYINGREVTDQTELNNLAIDQIQCCQTDDES